MLEPLTERLLPIVVARASQVMLHPLHWGALELLVLGLFVEFGLEFYRSGVPSLFAWCSKLPVRGKPLDAFERRDRQFVAFSHVAIVVMTFHYLQFLACSPNVIWRIDEMTVANTCIPLPAFFLVYDLFYAPFHRALHHRSIYAYVHKHHHRQVVPTRGNSDAINVHPLEFIMGEYNHIFAVFLVSRFIIPCHTVACVLFLVIGAHDTHHVIPNSNYGQYIMFWDFLMGTFKHHPRDKEDMVDVDWKRIGAVGEGQAMLGKEKPKIERR